jgi:uncharacterized membrane protein
LGRQMNCLLCKAGDKDCPCICLTIIGLILIGTYGRSIALLDCARELCISMFVGVGYLFIMNCYAHYSMLETGDTRPGGGGGFFFTV